MSAAEESHVQSVHRRLRDAAHDGLRDAILSGALDPGEQLDAHRLEGRLGAPVSAIHDAMTALVVEGLLDREDETFQVVNPDPETVGDTLKTIGVLMGGVVRQTVPVLTPNGKAHLLERIAHVRADALRQEPRSHAQRALEFYSALLYECPNPVLADLARSSLVPLSYHYLVTIDQRALDWQSIVDSWDELRDGILTDDQIRGELAIEALHGLPVSHK